MKNYFFPTLILSALLLLTACGSNSTTTTDENHTFTLNEKKFLHTLFLTEYLWYDQIPFNVDYETFSDPKPMINTLRVTPPDLWSFTITKQQYEDFANQKTAGFGFGYYRSDFTLYLVRTNAPAYQKLFRGDKIVEINGKPVTSDLIKEAGENLGTSATFRVVRGATEIDVTVTPQEYSFTVSEGKVIRQEGKKIGYLRFDSFTGSAVVELETIFTQFKSEAIDELVIDLRYNGGGSLATASALIDNITHTHAGERQIYLDWNANYKEKNSYYYFEEEELQDGNELNMKRVLFLVTQNSASASEAVISALTPHLGSDNIITIGSQTHGKPVGMTGRTYEENYYFLINFFVRNYVGETTDFEGIPVTCSALDDLTHFRGDANETMLKTALTYIATGGC